MHVLLGVLTAIVSILYALDRLGIDLGGMNPFHWYRRRAFAKKYVAIVIGKRICLIIMYIHIIMPWKDPKLGCSLW